jgi:prevent-host-death family protein
LKISSEVERMTITTLSSRELNQDVTGAKKATNKGPVIITDRGKPAHVLLRFEDYQRLIQQRRNIAESLAMPGVADIEFEPPRLSLGVKPADFS